ncbi:MAG: cytochrome c oxidase subunit II [Burkholderiales bacterium]|nr:MAG: cytochrome c oxidase subunit II [Burkholderiales bacterium]
MRLNRIADALALASLGGWASIAAAVQDMPGGPRVNQLNLAAPVTRIAEDQHWIHWFLMWVCLAIFVAVFGVMFYSVWKHRKSKGHAPAEFHESTTVEIAWTVVPFLIVVGMALPATRMVVEQKDTSNADVTVKATGYQWKWGYDYLKGDGEGISYLSTLSTPREQIEDRNYPDAKARRLQNPTYLMEVDNPLVVPVNRKIRVVVTANDVIHSWMVPSFGVKQDAIPGFVRDTWFRAEKVGVFRGQCAELCGKDHAFMPIVVDVRSQADYLKWVEEKKKEMLAKADDPTRQWALADLQARGEKVYASNCAACHQPTGKGVPGAFAALDGSKVVLGTQQAQIDLVLNGKPGTAMASFKQLSDTELAAVITYTRNAWSNKAEDNIVQPAEVMAARK